ncbi:non-muscle caldesmon [Myripristis murdjan]|uniref:non-muscle caldesmon n=1 Tax=Myripristis murdjan TaxID=586833 RepID=UPI001175F565|nr:non-muscle caldesmon-like [Myripristis murdjan]
MSSAILRRNSSKQGLQNLMRVTAQRSIEDAEEAERERRRRAREAFRRMNVDSTPGEPALESETPAEENTYDGGLKPSSSPSLEEDEGFSDWTQRRERRRQQRLQELSQGAEEEEDDEEEKHTNTTNRGAPVKKTIASSSSSSSSSSARLQRQQQEQEEADRTRMQADRRKEREEEQMRMTKRREETQRPDEEVEKRREVKVSYTSKVFLQQDARDNNTNGDADEEDVTSYVHNKTKRSSSRGMEAEEAEEAAEAEAEQRLEKIRRSHQQKESQELLELRHRQAEAEQELEELKRRREERRRVREEEERRRDEEEQQRLAREEEERRRMKEDIERRRMEAAERMKSLSSSSVEGDESFSPFSPKTPTHKITERTESLNRSLKKSNSFKKTQLPVLLSKIDDKLEQYAHAVENSQEARVARPGPADLPSSPEVVASKKNLFEAGEAWNQSPAKAPASKDTEVVKVGVAGLITQWVKSSPDGSRPSPSRPADVKPGDVMQKRNMWEIIGDSSARTGPRAKGAPSGKRYKFVVTGHGKYEKIFVDDEDGHELSNGKSGLCNSDY